MLVAASVVAPAVFISCDDGGDPLSPVGVALAAVDCSVTAAPATSHTVADAMAANAPGHEDPADGTWDAAAVVPITLSGATISVGGAGATVVGSTVTITGAGTYSVSGSLDNGQIVVDTDDADPVQLILNGATIANSGNAAIVVLSAEKTVMILADGTVNRVTDGDTYPAGIDPNAAIFSKDPLSIMGTGSLVVDARFNDGITSKDGLVIDGGVITVTSVDDGIRGKDYLLVRSGTLDVTAGGDGLKSDNDKDATLGWILVEDGTIGITAGGDGIAAETDALIVGGALTITSGGGSGAVIDEDLSAKGMKGSAEVVVDGGTFTIDAADDGLHSKALLVINGGTLTIASGDDGIHADTDLLINDGDITVTKSYEGIENELGDLTINGGRIHVVSSDDGINVAGNGDAPPGTPPGDYSLYINGGYIVSDATGDGIDVNGYITMSAGCVIVHGPTANNNGAIDYDGSFRMNGGYLVAVGSAGMAQAPGTSSSQYSVLATFGTTRPAGTLVHLQSADGQGLLDFTPARSFQSMVFSSPMLTNGAAYSVYTGGSASGTEEDGLYRSGTYDAGSRAGTFTISGMVSRVSF